MATKAVQQQNPAGLQLAVNDEYLAAMETAVSFGLGAKTATALRRLFAMGAAMEQLTRLLSKEVMAPMMALQNNPIGYLTDRPAGYSVDIVRTAVIQALLTGLDIVGNQFNIISGRLYITKQGMFHLLKQIPGLRYHVTPGIPKAQGEQGAICPVTVDYTYNGEHFTQQMEFAVRRNSGMGADALNGKATRKALAWLYAEITGNAMDEGEVGDREAVDITPRRSPLETAPAAPQPQLQPPPAPMPEPANAPATTPEAVPIPAKGPDRWEDDGLADEDDYTLKGM